MSKNYYYQHAGELNRELKASIPKETLKELHHKTPYRHFLIVIRQLALLVGLPLLIFYYPSFWVWIPAGFLLGFVVFNFSILLHEAIHKAIFNKDPYKLSYWLGQLYATLSGLSYSQFRRWHLDHHNELGTDDQDPKRANLSPKVNARWYKLLYCTPALYPIYFRAAKKAQAEYSPELRAQIKKERFVTIGFHLSILGLFFWIHPVFALKAYVWPVFFVFPIAFTVNRLGQHYVIDPDKIANWSTLMRPNFAWNFIYLFSSYHLEHHYYPGVPFYKLKALQKALDPFYEKHQIPTYSYTRLLKLWFIDNHKPHTAPVEKKTAKNSLRPRRSGAS